MLYQNYNDDQSYVKDHKYNIIQYHKEIFYTLESSIISLFKNLYIKYHIKITTMIKVTLNKFYLLFHIHKIHKEILYIGI